MHHSIQNLYVIVTCAVSECRCLATNLDLTATVSNSGTRTKSLISLDFKTIFIIRFSSNAIRFRVVEITIYITSFKSLGNMWCSVTKRQHFSSSTYKQTRWINLPVNTFEWPCLLSERVFSTRFFCNGLRSDQAVSADWFFHTMWIEFRSWCHRQWLPNVQDIAEQRTQMHFNGNVIVCDTSKFQSKNQQKHFRGLKLHSARLSSA